MLSNTPTGVVTRTLEVVTDTDCKVVQLQSLSNATEGLRDFPTVLCASFKISLRRSR